MLINNCLAVYGLDKAVDTNWMILFKQRVHLLYVFSRHGFDHKQTVAGIVNFCPAPTEGIRDDGLRPSGRNANSFCTLRINGKVSPTSWATACSRYRRWRIFRGDCERPTGSTLSLWNDWACSLCGEKKWNDVLTGKKADWIEYPYLLNRWLSTFTFV